MSAAQQNSVEIQLTVCSKTSDSEGFTTTLKWKKADKDLHNTITIPHYLAVPSSSLFLQIVQATSLSYDSRLRTTTVEE